MGLDCTQLEPLLPALKTMAVTHQAAVMCLLKRQHRLAAAANGGAWVRSWWEPTSLLSRRLLGGPAETPWLADAAEATMRSAMLVANLILLPQLAATGRGPDEGRRMAAHLAQMTQTLRALTRSTCGWFAACASPTPEQQQLCLEAVGACAAGCVAVLEGEVVGETFKASALSETLLVFDGLWHLITGWVLPDDSAAADLIALAAAGAAEAAARLLGVLVQQSGCLQLWMQQESDLLMNSSADIVGCVVRLLDRVAALVGRGSSNASIHRYRRACSRPSSGLLPPSQKWRHQWQAGMMMATLEV